MTEFVIAVNRNGVKQRVPAAWLEPGSPFRDDFRLPPSARPTPDPEPAEAEPDPS